MALNATLEKYMTPVNIFIFIIVLITIYYTYKYYKNNCTVEKMGGGSNVTLIEKSIVFDITILLNKINLQMNQTITVQGNYEYYLPVTNLKFDINNNNKSIYITPIYGPITGMYRRYIPGQGMGKIPIDQSLMYLWSGKLDLYIRNNRYYVKRTLYFSFNGVDAPYDAPEIDITDDINTNIITKCRDLGLVCTVQQTSISTTSNSKNITTNTLSFNVSKAGENTTYFSRVSAVSNNRKLFITSPAPPQSRTSSSSQSQQSTSSTCPPPSCPPPSCPPPSPAPPCPAVSCPSPPPSAGTNI